MSWQNQETLYVIMWRSKRSGATLSELRKTKVGMERLIETLEFLGYNRNEVIVTEQQKAWKPKKLGGFKRKKGGVNNDVKLHF